MDKRRNILKILMGVAFGVGLIGIMLIGFRFAERYLDKPVDDDEYSYSTYEGEQVFYNGGYYAPKRDLETFLILGVDRAEDRPNSEQADFVALVLMDNAAERYRILQLNRDTMVNMPTLDAFGNRSATVYAQLALAHTYGPDERARCRNTVATVESLLYGITVDHFLSLTMDAVPLLNDSVGGVRLALLCDMPALGSEYVEGATVTLRGEDALTYVRARGSLEDSTNLSRMERQKQYIGALMDAFATAENIDATAVITTLTDHMDSDCSVERLNLLAERMSAYTYDGLVATEGEAVMGEQFMEYHVNETALKEQVIHLFYDPVA